MFKRAAVFLALVALRPGGRVVCATTACDDMFSEATKIKRAFLEPPVLEQEAATELLGRARRTYEAMKAADCKLWEDYDGPEVEATLNLTRVFVWGMFREDVEATQS